MDEGDSRIFGEMKVIIVSEGWLTSNEKGVIWMETIPERPSPSECELNRYEHM